MSQLPFINSNYINGLSFRFSCPFLQLSSLVNFAALLPFSNILTTELSQHENRAKTKWDLIVAFLKYVILNQITVPLLFPCVFPFDIYTFLSIFKLSFSLFIFPLSLTIKVWSFFGLPFRSFVSYSLLSDRQMK